MGDRKGLLSLLLLTATLGFACLPKPEEEIEWVQRENAVIVQRKTLENAESELAQRFAVPDFTLYGDGTLIYVQQEGDGPPRLLRAELPEDAVRDLLEFIVDEDFLVFDYQQPTPERQTERPTTYIYVHTKLEANAVSAYALDSVLPEGAGKEWEQFRRLQEITERLAAIDPAGLGGSQPVDYWAEAVLLVTQTLGTPNTVGSPLAWPIPEIDLAAMAQPGDGVIVRRLDGAAARALYETFVPLGPPLPLLGPYLQKGRYFLVGLRPILPFEENFPEFEGP